MIFTSTGLSPFIVRRLLISDRRGSRDRERRSLRDSRVAVVAVVVAHCHLNVIYTGAKNTEGKYGRGANPPQKTNYYNFHILYFRSLLPAEPKPSPLKEDRGAQA